MIQPPSRGSSASALDERHKDFPGFGPADFDVFAIDGLEPRMSALISGIRPKLEELGSRLSPSCPSCPARSSTLTSPSTPGARSIRRATPGSPLPPTSGATRRIPIFRSACGAPMPSSSSPSSTRRKARPSSRDAPSRGWTRSTPCLRPDKATSGPATIPGRKPRRMTA